MNFRLSLIFVLALVIIGLPVSVLAVSPSSISVEVAPPNPNPNENVTITLRSFSANLDTVNIEWLVNGKSTSSGIGKKSFSITAGSANTETKVEAKIYLPDGQIDKRVIIRPSVMVLLWQALDSYVPPFYKGKAMPSLGSNIKVVAMPEIRAGGAMISPNNMTYSWKKDYTNQPNASGYGKNYFTYLNDYLEDVSTVDATAHTTDQQYSTGASISVGAFSPKILFYRIDSALGIIWERALANNHRINGEEIMMATPYFISPKDIRRPELIFRWFINDSLISSVSYKKNVLPLRAQVGTSGSSRLRLQIENQAKIFQSAKKEINLQF